MSKDTDKLRRMGFVEVGVWKKPEHAKQRYKYDFSMEKAKKWRTIYVYVLNGRAKYVGICATYGDGTAKNQGTALETRLRRHKWNERNNKYSSVKELSRAVRKGHRVKIYAIPENLKKRYFRGLKIDLVSGLEKPLIVEMRTKKPHGWNTQC